MPISILIDALSFILLYDEDISGAGISCPLSVDVLPSTALLVPCMPVMLLTFQRTVGVVPTTEVNGFLLAVTTLKRKNIVTSVKDHVKQHDLPIEISS